MSAKSILKKTSAVLCALAVWTACLTYMPSSTNLLTVCAGKSLSELEAEKKQLADEKKQVKNKLAELEKNAEEQEQYQAYYAEQIEIQEKELDIVNAQAAELETQISDLNGRIEQQKQDIDKSIVMFRDRLRAMYIAGDASYASVIAGSSDFYEMLARMEMVKRVSVHDKELIDDLNKQLDDYNLDCETLNTRLDQQKQAISEQETLLAELQDSYNNSVEVLEMINKEAEDYAARSEEIDAEEEKVEKELQAEIKRLASQEKVFVGSDFTWPAPAVHNLSDGYGWRNLFGKQNFHKGVDITKPGCAGKDIVAAQAGTVILAQKTYTPGYSYGKYVIIDHGGGYNTLYGHCSEVYVTKGQTVTKGQKIAAIGNTGNSYGAHLHFEVRINGQHTDPMKFYKKQ